MLLPHAKAGLLALGLVMHGAGTHAQSYPNKPIRIVTSEPGGGSDLTARLLAQALAANVGQSVIVENRPSNTLGGLVSKAQPDGYTLLLSGGSFLLGPLLEKTSYQVLKDFAPITLTATVPNLVVLHPSLPPNSVKELIALAKAKPGQLNYASTGAGGIAHLSVELFKSMAGVDIVRVNYKGTGQAVNDLIAGQVQMMIPAVVAVMPHVKSGKLKALAITSAKSSELAPGLPTVASSGLPGYEAGILFGLYAPVQTPVSIVNRLNHEAVQILSRPEIKEKLLGAGLEVVVGSPQESAAAIKSEQARTSKVIKDAGIRVD